MAATVLGSGARAVRIELTETGVQLRHGATIIDGNLDAAIILRWVINHPEAEGRLADELPGLQLQNISAFLTRLARAGVPVSLWGKAWQCICLPIGGTDGP